MHKLRHYRELYELSIEDLSILSDVSTTAIRRIEGGKGINPYKTHRGVATALASALDVSVDQLFDQTELSHLGRPPHTGTPLTSSSAIDERREALCSTCYLVMRRGLGCAMCVA